jgi:hypothetical protein
VRRRARVAAGAGGSAGCRSTDDLRRARAGLDAAAAQRGVGRVHQAVMRAQRGIIGHDHGSLAAEIIDGVDVKALRDVLYIESEGFIPSCRAQPTKPSISAILSSISAILTNQWLDTINSPSAQIAVPHNIPAQRGSHQDADSRNVWENESGIQFGRPWVRTERPHPAPSSHVS